MAFVIFFLTLLSISSALIYALLKYHYDYWNRHNIPHEKPDLFFGNMRGIGTLYHWTDINRRIYMRFRDHKSPIVGYFTFLNKSVMITDLDLIKQIMIKDFASFPNRGLFHNVRDDPLTGNLLFLDGEPWRILRHKLSTVFTTGKMRFMFPTIVDVGKQLTATCQAHVTAKSKNKDSNTNAKSNSNYNTNITTTIDAKDLCARYTTDVIGTCAFGIECNSLRDPNAEFRQMGRNVVEKPRHSLPVQAWMFAAPKMAEKLRMKNFSDESTDFFMGVVRETVKFRERNNVRRNDFMDLLLELKAKRDALDKVQAADLDDLNNGLTIEQLAAQAMIFFLAGFESSSTTLSFCLYELALNEEIQNKLRDEITSVLEKNNQEITYETVRDMKYLEMVISETLRKYSVLPHIIRKATADFKVPNTEFVIENGMSIIIPVDAIQKDPKYFPDPEKFDPERFTPENIVSRHAFSYLPFGEGPRNCIGSRFGKFQTQVALISLLPKFRFTSAPQTPKQPVPISKKMFIVTPAAGVPLNVQMI